jgi:phage-related tail protein
MTARMHGISRSIPAQLREPGDTRTEVGYAVAEVVQLVDGSQRERLNALSRTLFLALDRRDRAIEDIRLLAPLAPRSEDIARVRARRSQDEDEASRSTR